MIDEICVHDIALIREAVMTPSSGLTVLTGETGAGKTALLSACKLLMGERADKSVVREGADHALVEGRFYVDARALSEELEAASEEDAAEEADGDVEVVVSRRLSADGRSRVSVNGRMSSVSQLSRIVAPTVELCGQHEQQVLMKPASHVKLLDAWAFDETAELVDAYREALAAARAAAEERDRVRDAAGASAASLEEARFALRQIEAVDPSEEEHEELVAYLAKAEHAEALARSANGAYEALSGEGGALDALSSALDALQEGARYDDELGGYVSSLRDAGFVLEDVARDVLTYRDGIDFDGEALARAQERIAAYQGLLRSYGPRLEDVLARQEEARDLVEAVDDADARMRAAERVLAEAEGVLAERAQALHAARADAAPRFAAEVNKVMARLEMGSAELLCATELLPRSSWTSAGPSSVEFLFRPGAGMQARPLARIASGGEISRVMLAVHVALGERDGASTLVFDEVDAGVGGATAVALAGVLADLAKTHQVIAVTHLAQVAVAADTHYVVAKTDGDLPRTELYEVQGVQREAEVARMLSGDATETAVAHAREMLSSAHRG